LLARVFVADLTETTTQWREYLFNTLDPDGPILENLVINSTAFALATSAEVWENPDTGDTYTYDGDFTVTKTAGTGPTIPPPLPDLSDPYGLRYLHEWHNWDGLLCRAEIYQKDYAGEEEEEDGGANNVNLTIENEGKLFVSFRGSRASVTLNSAVSRKFYELFEGDERKHYLRLVIDSVAVWTGWITPDVFSEPWKNGPYQTNINFNDGIGGLKNIPFPDVNDNGFTGLVSEKDAIIACLSGIGLRLDVHIACNIRTEAMDTFSQPIEQSSVNVEAFVKFNQGERQPVTCYSALEKILKSWHAVLFQQENKWWIIREPELYGATLIYKRFDADGLALGTATRSLEKTFNSESISLHGATLETIPAFTNVAVSQEYGELLVENGNFAINGNFENWNPLIIGGYQQGWVLKNWVYENLSPYPFRYTGSLGRVRRVTENTGLSENNNYINIYEVVRDFADPVGRLVTQATPIKQEIGNLIQLTFKVRANTKGSDNRLVEAYFNVAVQCGSKWLSVDAGTGEYEWTATETRIRWKVAEVMRWENITIPAIAIPEDGDLKAYIYQIVQVGSVSKVEYVCDFDDVELRLVDNPALQNARIFYKTNNPEVYTSTLEELEIELGDVATVLSQNAKIVNGEPTSDWFRPGETPSQPLAKLLCRELANQYQITLYRLRGGKCRSTLSLLANYEDSDNEPDRKFIVTGGDWNLKTGYWNPDFIEINQEETTVEIRIVEEAREGTKSDGSNSGGGDLGNETPVTPGVPLDLGDEDDLIPIINDGKFEDSGIIATRVAGVIEEYEFPKVVKGVEGTDPNHFVVLSQLGGLDYTPSTGSIKFDVPRKYGYNGTLVSTALTLDFTGAKEVNMPKVLHQGASLSISSSATLHLTSGVYYSGEINEVLFICHKNDLGSVTRVSYSIAPNLI